MKSALAGAGEIAEMLGVSRQRVHQLSSAYSDFPKPIADLKSGRIWEAADIRKWKEKHPQRLPGRRSSS